MNKEELIEIMNTYGDYLKKSAFHVLHDMDLAEDMVQETFISFYRKQQFKHQSSLKTYLYSILMNHIKMYLRKYKIKEISAERYISHESVDFENKSVNTMDISYAIQDLHENYRMVIILYYFDDYSIQEIAKIMNKSKASVKMSLKRARDHLKKKLGGYYENQIG